MQKAVKDSPLRFSRANRLVSKHDFQSVFQNARKITRSYLLILYRLNELTHARLGIIINKHHVPHAVDRNQIRRVIRESFRHQQKALKTLDIIVLVRSKCTASKQSLRDEINQIWVELTN